MSEPFQTVMEEITTTENRLISEIIKRLERNEVDPVLKVLYRWGKEPIKILLESIDERQEN